MRFRRKHTWMLLAIAAVSAVLEGPMVAWAQPEAVTNATARPELALGYSYVRSNAPPGGCACFNQNGGSATFAWPLMGSQFALVGDVTATYAGGIASNVYGVQSGTYSTGPGGGYGLTMSTYTAGVRYSPKVGRFALQPFGQVLVGLAHASGTLVNGADTNVGNAGAAFASIVGGGADWRLSRRLAIRLGEADYLLTTFDNGGNNHQNNLRINTGVVVRF